MFRNNWWKIGLVAGMGGLGAAPAMAQTASLDGPPKQWFSYAGDRQTWNTVMLVSGIVGFVGLVDNDPTLVILGGVGVLVSVFEENNQMRYRFGTLAGGDGLIRTGRFSFGFTQVPGIALAPGLAAPAPGAFAQYNIRM